MPCPFCGRLPTFRRTPFGLRENFWMLSCRGVCPGSPISTGSTKAQALVEWNTRKNPVNPVQK